MDGRKALEADPLDAPVIAPAIAPDAATPVARPAAVAAPVARREYAPPTKRRMSGAWALALGIAGIGFQLALATLTPLPDADAAAPGGVLAVALNGVALSLLAAPLLALGRRSVAGVAGIIGTAGFLGFQAECLMRDHIGFFTPWFLALNVAAAGLLAISVGAWASVRNR